MEQAHGSWIAKVGAWPRKVLTGSIVQLRKRCRQLKNRYGPRYTCAMVSAGFFTFFVPIPGISLLSVCLIVAIAEVHRAISNRGGSVGRGQELDVIV